MFRPPENKNDLFRLLQEFLIVYTQFSIFLRRLSGISFVILGRKLDKISLIFDQRGLGYKIFKNNSTPFTISVKHSTSLLNDAGEFEVLAWGVGGSVEFWDSF
jgi:hypothetical protein